MGFLSDHKSTSPTGFNSRVYSGSNKRTNHPTSHSEPACKLIHMTGSKKYRPGGQTVQSRVGLDL
jgi:hypothetical protein